MGYLVTFDQAGDSDIDAVVEQNPHLCDQF